MGELTPRQACEQLSIGYPFLHEGSTGDELLEAYRLVQTASQDPQWKSPGSSVR